MTVIKRGYEDFRVTYAPGHRYETELEARRDDAIFKAQAEAKATSGEEILAQLSPDELSALGEAVGMEAERIRGFAAGDRAFDKLKQRYAAYLPDHGRPN